MGWECTSGLLRCCSHGLSSPSSLCRLLICAIVLIVRLECISSSLHFARLPSTEEWFNVQMNLSKAINTRSVMIPADLQMELLILLSLFLPHPPSSSSFLRSSGTILADSFLRTLLLALPLLSVCCRCRAVAPTKKEEKKNLKR